MNSLAYSTTYTYSKAYQNEINEKFTPHCDNLIKIIITIGEPFVIRINGGETILRKGDVMLISPGVIHSTKNLTSDDTFIVKADLSGLENSSAFNGILDNITPFLTISPDSNPIMYNDLNRKVLQINSEYKFDKTLAQISTYSLLLDIFIHVKNNQNKETLKIYTPEKYNYTKKFAEVCDYINKNCTENLTLDDISKVAGISKFHFSRLFKQFNNITFHKYLNQTRINYAVSLFENEENTITEIALSSGFNSLSTFIRIFKQEKRCTPREYKKAHIS
ncbi:AraC family transcriptional regulator [Thiospirochaeta perfilievii]|uniref:AraC family transcriptional regulator n=1 Tax=Thiospirochaeta perfilievii TaxID=252967 RepID=A0A5C1Q956_9SPIO|nr:AraC family transcriptional regulator [Thiospirochaeta perfilievii]QEN03439.1 AraC family transcriptional regulator [Thiospirochaeta perfilievii]